VTGLEALLSSLCELASATGAPEQGTGIDVTRLELDLPLEARIAPGAVLLASLPRGLLATGFELPRCRLRARYEVSP
jgi:hypothetical protein